MKRAHTLAMTGCLLLLALIGQIGWSPGRLTATVGAAPHSDASQPFDQQLPVLAREPAPPGPATPPTAVAAPPVQVTLAISEQLRWTEQLTAGLSYDLVIVGDWSLSNQKCWRNTNQCPAPYRRIDYEVAGIRRLVDELLVRQNGAGADHRVGFVIAGQTVNGQHVPRAEVTLAMTPAMALDRYGALIGRPGSPRLVPNAELSSANPTASGIEAALSLFDAGRSVDRKGKPVQRAVLVLMNETANVLIDPPFAGIHNNGRLPFECKPTNPNGSVSNDPQTQYTCPAANQPQNTTGVRPPLRAAVEIADAGRDLRRVQFFALGYGPAGSPSAEQLRLHLMAPTDYLRAAPDQFNTEIDRIIGRLGAQCQPRAASARPAAGASIQIVNANQTVVFSGTADAAGRISATLTTGDYTLRASHANVVAPADPEQRPRSYGLLVTDAQPAPRQSAPLAISAPSQIRALLTLTNPTDAACP